MQFKKNYLIITLIISFVLISSLAFANNTNTLNITKFRLHAGNNTYANFVLVPQNGNNILTNQIINLKKNNIINNVSNPNVSLTFTGTSENPTTYSQIFNIQVPNGTIVGSLSWTVTSDANGSVISNWISHNTRYAPFTSSNTHGGVLTANKTVNNNIYYYKLKLIIINNIPISAFLNSTNLQIRTQSASFFYKSFPNYVGLNFSFYNNNFFLSFLNHLF